MKKWAYYNEVDPFAAAWIRELIKDGLVAPGEVDERSIEDVLPTDVASFTQCHWFAGIAIWSLALRQAGWGDDRPIWTGSCPCQPFSSAGKGGGFDDERHLWPAFHWLIDQCRPERILGEQVASKDGLAWLDLVQADLEASRYAFGAVDTCAAGFGAPHIRQRLYWMADADQGQRGRLTDSEGCQRNWTAIGRQQGDGQHQSGCDPSRLANANDTRLSLGSAHANGCGAVRHEGHSSTRSSLPSGLDDAASARHERALSDTEGYSRDEARLRVPDTGCAESGLGDTRREPDERRRETGHLEHPTGEEQGEARQRQRSGDADSGAISALGRPGPLNGLWRDADWLCCTDGKWRPVSAGTFPLADAGTVRNRVGTLRGAGNAINLAQAVGFIEAVKDYHGLIEIMA